MKSRVMVLGVVLIAFAGLMAAQQEAAKAGLLSAEEVKKALPETVFFAGEKAPVQLRNAGGIRFGGGKLALLSLVDTSGYSTAIQEKYQAYLITEVKLKVGDHEVAPGAYGCGVVNGRFLVMDIAANDLFSVDAPVDTELKRPRPFMLTVDGDGYRVHFGKNMVRIAAAH